MRDRTPRDRTDDPSLPRPRKRLGQHFLVDRRVLERITDALAPTNADTVVEIGPGRGALTDLLAARAGRVVAIELDRDLVPYLRDRYAQAGNVHVIERDVLDLTLADAAGTPDFLLAGNVPYYITTPILFHALETPRPRRAVFLVQREVAERVAAQPGSKTYGALSVNVQAVATAELVARVPAGAFRPPPSVESAVLRVIPRADPVVPPSLEEPYRRLVQEAFGLRRKQLRRVVRTVARVDADRADAILARAGLEGELRPESLSPEDFARLLAAIAGVSDRGS
ncbi:MAG TPA: 16S rRNA (adenine(1518)-N(6)/adenine(1519)-N(6))-dimethyltransferase RsmA [Gemmatimonadaceae bacterium]|nr:16S rRNA (adenine(1518)-N(6)/adenine(1519)-N(6))-dimethyltransferase RsmA [Gemmatimonadaceae bacterium]